MDDLNRMLWEAIEDYMAEVHTIIPGEVVKYNPETRRADIQPSIKRKMPDGSFVELPVIPEVLVRYSGNKEYTIHFPLKPGDEVVMFAVERGTDTWKGKGHTGIEENDLRRFDIQDCIAITGGAPVEFIPVKEEGLNIVHHKTDPKGDWISTVTMDDEKIEAKYKEKCRVTMTDDKVTAITEKTKFEMTAGVSTLTSVDTDINSDKPIGIKGTNTQLGGDVLQKFWDDMNFAISQYPLIIPPVPWPPGIPVPPAPPLINMALNGIIMKLKSAIATAKASCAKALK